MKTTAKMKNTMLCLVIRGAKLSTFIVAVCVVATSCFDSTSRDQAARNSAEIIALQKRVSAAEKRSNDLEAKLVELHSTTKRATDAMSSFLAWTVQQSGGQPDANAREVAGRIIHSQLIAALPAAVTSDEATNAAAARLGASNDFVNANYYEAPAVISAHCTKDWPDDFHMREVCEREQREGVETLKETRPNIPVDDFSVIRNKCGREWLDDYHMRTVCEREQIQSYSNLHRY